MSAWTTLSTKSLQTLLELAMDHDLYDTSRYEGQYSALKEVCTTLELAGVGAQKLEGGCITTTPSELLTYIRENS